MTSLYQPQNDPPLIREKLIAIRSEILVLLMASITSIQVMIDPFVPSWLFSQALGEIAPETALIMGGLTILGVILSVLGLFIYRENQVMSWTLEKTGWLLQGIGWFLYALSIFTVFPYSTISWGMALFFLFFSLLRIYTLRKIEQYTREGKSKLEKMTTGEVPAVD